MSEARALEGRRALVTGASRGIGRATAFALARAGAAVAVAYSAHPESAEAVVAALRDEHEATAVALGLILLWLPETLETRGAGRGFGSMLHGSVRLLRSRAFLGYAIGGSCTTTSFYAFMAASPFIFANLLHRPTQELGLYYLLLMGGVALGGFSANRMAGRVRPRTALRIANGLAIAAAAASWASSSCAMRPPNEWPITTGLAGSRLMTSR